MGWREEDDGKSAEERGVRRPCGDPDDDDDDDTQQIQHIPTSHIPTRWESVTMMNCGNMKQSQFLNIPLYVQFNVYSLSLSVFSFQVQTPLKIISLRQFKGTIRQSTKFTFWKWKTHLKMKTEV